MTLTKLIQQLTKLEEQGHGNKEVFYRHGASGDSGPVGSAHVATVNNDGPYDLDPGEQYVSMYVGN